MENGWVRLYRCLLDKAVWKCSNPEQRCVLITLLLMANHEPKQWVWQGNKYEVGAGQLITSLNNVSLKAGASIQSVRSAIQKFEKLKFLTNKSTKTGRLITILNWELYQPKKEETDKETDNDPTKPQQTTDKGSTPNNNDNNDNNDENDKKESRKNQHGFQKTNIGFVPPSVEEVRAYCTERNNGIDADAFVNFYASKGWKVGSSKMKDWKACVKTWEQRKKADAKPKKPAAYAEPEKHEESPLKIQFLEDEYFNQFKR